MNFPLPRPPLSALFPCSLTPTTLATMLGQEHTQQAPISGSLPWLLSLPATNALPPGSPGSLSSPSWTFCPRDASSVRPLLNSLPKTTHPCPPHSLCPPLSFPHMSDLRHTSRLTFYIILTVCRPRVECESQGQILLSVLMSNVTVSHTCQVSYTCRIVSYTFQGLFLFFIYSVC